MVPRSRFLSLPLTRLMDLFSFPSPVGVSRFLRLFFSLHFSPHRKYFRFFHWPESKILMPWPGCFPALKWAIQKPELFASGDLGNGFPRRINQEGPRGGQDPFMAFLQLGQRRIRKKSFRLKILPPDNANPALVRPSPRRDVCWPAHRTSIHSGDRPGLKDFQFQNILLVFFRQRG